MDVALRYVGKKLPFTFKNPILGDLKQLRFIDHQTPVLVNQEIADWIFKHNPTGFVEEVSRSGSKPVEDVAAVIIDTKAKIPKLDLMCPRCFKKYTDQRWYDKHVEKCMPKTPFTESSEPLTSPVADDGSFMEPTDDAA